MVWILIFSHRCVKSLLGTTSLARWQGGGETAIVAGFFLPPVELNTSISISIFFRAFR